MKTSTDLFTMRHVPVWVEAILQERGTTFPEINDWSFWSCCSRDLGKQTEALHYSNRLEEHLCPPMQVLSTAWGTISHWLATSQCLTLFNYFFGPWEDVFIALLTLHPPQSTAYAEHVNLLETSKRSTHTEFISPKALQCPPRRCLRLCVVLRARLITLQSSF